MGFPPRPHMGVALIPSSEQAEEDDAPRKNSTLHDTSPHGSRREHVVRASFADDALVASETPVVSAKEPIVNFELQNDNTTKAPPISARTSREVRSSQFQSTDMPLMTRAATDGGRSFVSEGARTSLIADGLRRPRRPSWAVSSEGSSKEAPLASVEPTVLVDLPGLEDDYQTLRRRITIRPPALNHTRVAC